MDIEDRYSLLECASYTGKTLQQLLRAAEAGKLVIFRDEGGRAVEISLKTIAKNKFKSGVWNGNELVVEWEDAFVRMKMELDPLVAKRKAVSNHSEVTPKLTRSEFANQLKYFQNKKKKKTGDDEEDVAWKQKMENRSVAATQYGVGDTEKVTQEPQSHSRKRVRRLPNRAEIEKAVRSALEDKELEKAVRSSKNEYVVQRKLVDHIDECRRQYALPNEDARGYSRRTIERVVKAFFRKNLRAK